MTKAEIPFTPKLFTSAADAMTFIQAGDATVTLKSLKTNTRYTYRIRESDDGKVFFVSVMCGSDNESHYMYAGVISNGVTRLTAKSKVQQDDVRWRAFEWTYAMLSKNVLPDHLQVWHEGRCGRCQHKLTVPESIARGIGPECAKHFKTPPTQQSFVNMLQAG